MCALVILLTVTHASAHEKWFHETENYGLRWDLFFRPLPLAFVGAVVVATLAAWFLYRRLGRAFVPGPEKFGATAVRRAALYGLIDTGDSRHSRRRAFAGERCSGRIVYAE